MNMYPFYLHHNSNTDDIKSLFQYKDHVIGEGDYQYKDNIISYL